MGTHRRRTQQGVGLTEQLMTLAVVAVLVGVSLGAPLAALDRHRMEGVASTLQTELNHARSLAIARGETVRVAFAADAQGSCWVVHTAKARQCSCRSDGTARCAGSGVILRSAAQPAAEGIRVASSATEIGFDATHGTVSPTTTLRLENARGDRLNLVINLMGRVRSCKPKLNGAGVAVC